MRIAFHGAAGMVTGSMFLARMENGKSVLVDCGLMQGSKSDLIRNHEEFPFDPASLDAVILTHAHIDHSGRLPKLVKDGFRGPVFCTPATADLLPLMLHDSAHIQRMENERFNKKRARQGEPPVPPLYDAGDVDATVKLVVPHAYGAEFVPVEGATARFRDAGHILGSSFVRLTDGSGAAPYTVTFSGDVGNAPAPILRDPEPFEATDALVLESTYGDRIRDADTDRGTRLVEVIRDARRRGGKIVVPAFALGRTQELLYELSELIKKRGIEPIPVFVDSPLARGATEVFRRHAECFDEAMRARLASGDDPFDFPGLTVVESADESAEVARRDGPAIVLSASGMCTAGRIKHHLRATIFRPQNTILFLGYQGRGTLGRQIREGEKAVRIHGREFAVRAKIESIDGFSAHADQRALIRFAESGATRPAEIILVHGEPEPQRVLAGELSARGFRVHVPGEGETLTLRAGSAVERIEGHAPRRAERPVEIPAPRPRAESKGEAAVRRADLDPRLAKALQELQALRGECVAMKRRIDQLLDTLDPKS